MLHADFDWKSPDYAKAFRQRMAFLRELRAHPEDLAALKTYYANNYADFISDWGVTYEPRNAEKKLPTLIPFVLFPKQREWVDWVIGHWRAGTPGLTEKSRDMGVSWLMMALSCTMCLFNDGVAIGVGSRKTEYVDKIGNYKPLLPKARMFMENLPSEFRAGWTPAHAPFMRVSFPGTGSIIEGEGGDDLGRGNRAQPLNAKILTPNGWKEMGDIQTGDEVIGANGAPTLVTGVYNRGERELYRIVFSDDSSTICCGEHLWRVTSKLTRKAERRRSKTAPYSLIVQTDIIKNSLMVSRTDGQTEYNYRIPLIKAPAQFIARQLPLDSYVMGALLGDGSLSQMDHTSVGFSTADIEMIETINARLPDNCVAVASGSQCGYRLTKRRGTRMPGHKSPMKEAVRAAGIANMKGPEKYIPDLYKFSSPNERLELLRGLLDTDGWVNTQHQARLASTSRRLIDDVTFIVQSLGGIATVSTRTIKSGTPLPTGRRRRDTIVHEAFIAMPIGMNPFRLTRKANKWRGRTYYAPSRSIVAVESVGRAETRCIRVAAQDHLYVTDDCIVTHNTSLFFVDEFAFFERPELTEMSLSQTTNCRIDVSTPNGMANPFAIKRHSGKIDVWLMDWRDDPRKDQRWYDLLSEPEDVGGKGLDEVTIAQEVDHSYSASAHGVVIPALWVKSAIDAHKKLGFDAPTGKRGLALDVADEGVDKNAVCISKGYMIERVEDWSGRGDDLFVTAERAFAFCDEYDLSEFEYDADGVGASIRGDSRVINKRREHAKQRQVAAIGFRGSEAVIDPDRIVEGTVGREGDKGRTNKDYFLNRKAQGWWALRRRFERVHRWVTKGVASKPDDVISISSECPNYMRLVAELSQATFEPNGVGKIVINKTPDGQKSPNLADSVVIRFAPKGLRPIRHTMDMVRQIQQAGRRPMG